MSNTKQLIETYLTEAFPKSKKKVDEICKEYNIKKYKINPDFSIDVEGNVDLNHKDFTTLPIKFNKVTGDFICYSCNKLTSLQGAPTTVGGDFYCSSCDNLTSLQGAPIKVGGEFNCYNCFKLTSLQGAPTTVGGNFECGSCYKLTSLQGAPTTVKGGFDCEGTPIQYVFEVFPSYNMMTKFIKERKVYE